MNMKELLDRMEPSPTFQLMATGTAVVTTATGEPANNNTEEKE